MSSNPAAKHEQRDRVTCHLPYGNAAEEKAFARVINYLQEQRRNRLGVTGYTFSDPSSFHGFWWSAKRRQWVQDRIVLLTIDYRVPIGNPNRSLLEHLERLKTVIEEAYSHFGSPQDEIWIVKHPIDRIL